MEEAKVEEKLKHLEFIQNTITRMASNSFMLKGWRITIIAALIALSIKESDFRLYLAAVIPTIMFWILSFNFDMTKGRKLWKRKYYFSQLQAMTDLTVH